jgi:hypothetical protein
VVHGCDREIGVRRYGESVSESRCEGCGEIQSRIGGSGRWSSELAAAVMVSGEIWPATVLRRRRSVSAGIVIVVGGCRGRDRRRPPASFMVACPWGTVA